VQQLLYPIYSLPWVAYLGMGLNAPPLYDGGLNYCRTYAAMIVRRAQAVKVVA